MSLIGRLLFLCFVGFSVSACVDDMQPPMTSYTGSTGYMSYASPPPPPRRYVIDQSWVSNGTVVEPNLNGGQRTCYQKTLVQLYNTGERVPTQTNNYGCGPWRYPYSSAYVGSPNASINLTWVGPGYYHHPHHGYGYYDRPWHRDYSYRGRRR